MNAFLLVLLSRASMRIDRLRTLSTTTRIHIVLLGLLGWLAVPLWGFSLSDPVVVMSFPRRPTHLCQQRPPPRTQTSSYYEDDTYETDDEEEFLPPLVKPKRPPRYGGADPLVRYPRQPRMEAYDENYDDDNNDEEEEEEEEFDENDDAPGGAGNYWSNPKGGVDRTQRPPLSTTLTPRMSRPRSVRRVVDDNSYNYKDDYEDEDDTTKQRPRQRKR
jgi:hypothetical protein